MIKRLTGHDAVIAVDVQNDFCPPDGALAVTEGDQVVPVLNRWFEEARRGGAAVVISRDWHPPDHCSFKARGGPWPAHCVQNTWGARYHPALRVPREAIEISKASDPRRDNFSDFAGTGVGDTLRQRGVTRLWVGGLATDYCVRATVLDALQEGFEVHVLVAAVRAVNVKPGDGDRALEEMRAAGAIIERDAT
jgi:nicotinamidase/pyrazinamidase